MKYIKLFEELDNTNPCAVYNADKKELIGLFKSRGCAAKYIFGHRNTSFIGDVSYAISRKYNLTPKTTKHPFKIAVRDLSDKQKELLGDKTYQMFNDYPINDFDFRSF